MINYNKNNNNNLIKIIINLIKEIVTINWMNSNNVQLINKLQTNLTNRKKFNKLKCYYIKAKIIDKHFKK